MTNLDLLLLKGANRDLTEENLAELRYTILTKGIPANSEGMVNTPPRRPQPQPAQSHLPISPPSSTRPPRHSSLQHPRPSPQSILPETNLST
jgi:hypothetical protein